MGCAEGYKGGQDTHYRAQPGQGALHVSRICSGSASVKSSKPPRLPNRTKTEPTGTAWTYNSRRSPLRDAATHPYGWQSIVHAYPHDRQRQQNTRLTNRDQSSRPYRPLQTLSPLYHPVPRRPGRTGERRRREGGQADVVAVGIRVDGERV